jgi:hypothetical protein
MPRIADIPVIMVLTLLAFSTRLIAAENRVPTPEEFKEVMRQYNESGKVIDLQRSRQIPQSVEQFNRALALHTKKDASAKELKEAASLYQAALEGGVAQAATNLALLYLEGKGVKKDVKKALSLLNSSSAKKDSQADITLARLYLNGTDVKKDEKKGESLLNKAAKAGNQNAAKILAEYKEWKKKNEIAMKQYQDLMKQVQSGQNKPGAVQPLQINPQPSSMARTGVLFPVIPGYAYVAGNQVPIPNFIAPLPKAQPKALNILPQGTSAVPHQPLNIIPQGVTDPSPLKLELIELPIGETSAPKPQPKPAAPAQNTPR